MLTLVTVGLLGIFGTIGLINIWITHSRVELHKKDELVKKETNKEVSAIYTEVAQSLVSRPEYHACVTRLTYSEERDKRLNRSDEGMHIINMHEEEE